MAHATTSLWQSWTATRDARAFAKLIDADVPYAFRWAYRLGCNAAEADDALQQALVRLATCPDDAPERVGVRAWLCREIRSHVRTGRRSERRRRRREARAARPLRYGDSTRRVDARDLVECALARLSPAEREAVELRYLQDLDYEAMALVLGVTPAACRQRVHRGLARLRTHLPGSAALLVGTLPLPPVPASGPLASSALAAGGFGAASTLGVLVMTTTSKLLLGGALVALGVAATLGSQAVLAASPADEAQPNDELRALLRARDLEITRLKQRLAPSSEPGLAARGPAAAPAAAATPPTQASPAEPPMRRGERWRRDLLSRSFPAKRNAAWKAVRDALAGKDRDALIEALHAIRFTPPGGDLDRTGIPELLAEHTRSEDETLRSMAWLARATIQARLVGAGAEPEGGPIDLDALRRDVARSSELSRAMLLGTLIALTNHTVTEDDQAVVLGMLDDPALAAEAVRGLAAAKQLEEPILKRLFTWSETSAAAKKQVLRTIVSGLRSKQPETIRWILDEIEAGTPHAIAALRIGVPPASARSTGARLRSLFDQSSDPRQRSQLIGAIGYVGDFHSRAWLETLSKDTTEPGLAFSAEVALRSLQRVAQGKEAGATPPRRR